ncbi:hypothetical protein [Cytobacillus kochii]|nr:hypothetical protein [Cytobacillus kochii]
MRNFVIKSIIAIALLSSLAVGVNYVSNYDRPFHSADPKPGS